MKLNIGIAHGLHNARKLLEDIKAGRSQFHAIEIMACPDGKFSLTCLRCVGACGLAPVAMVGDKVYGRLTPADIKGIVDEYRNME